MAHERSDPCGGSPPSSTFPDPTKRRVVEGETVTLRRTVLLVRTNVEILRALRRTSGRGDRVSLLREESRSDAKGTSR